MFEEVDNVALECVKAAAPAVQATKPSVDTGAAGAGQYAAAPLALHLASTTPAKPRVIDAPPESPMPFSPPALLGASMAALSLLNHTEPVLTHTAAAPTAPSAESVGALSARLSLGLGLSGRRSVGGGRASMDSSSEGRRVSMSSVGSCGSAASSGAASASSTGSGAALKRLGISGASAGRVISGAAQRGASSEAALARPLLSAAAAAPTAATTEAEPEEEEEAARAVGGGGGGGSGGGGGDGDAQQVVSELLRGRGGEHSEEVVLLEAGCGVGNTLFPLLRANPRLRVFGVDFADAAVEIVRKHPLAQAGRVCAAVGDLTSGALPPELGACLGRCDVATLMFVLSAISPEKMGAAIGAVGAALRPGGLLLIRDYAQGDGAQERFKASSRPKQLDEHGRFFVRQDGTRAYYFETAELAALAESRGFETLRCDVSLRSTVNRAKDLQIERRYVTATFCKGGAGKGKARAGTSGGGGGGGGGGDGVGGGGGGDQPASAASLPVDPTAGAPPAPPAPPEEAKRMRSKAERKQAEAERARSEEARARQERMQPQLAATRAMYGSLREEALRRLRGSSSDAPTAPAAAPSAPYFMPGQAPWVLPIEYPDGPNVEAPRNQGGASAGAATASEQRTPGDAAGAQQPPTALRPGDERSWTEQLEEARRHMVASLDYYPNDELGDQKREALRPMLDDLPQFVVSHWAERDQWHSHWSAAAAAARRPARGAPALSFLAAAARRAEDAGLAPGAT